jgi:hypothetical protein
MTTEHRTCWLVKEMANPTGTVYLTASNSYAWTNGNVYEIPQTDTVEGAATGASFNGLGVDNQPHQVLLNKVQFLYNRMVGVDEPNISYALAFLGGFASDAGGTGWASFEVTDSSRGNMQLIIQWGEILFGVRLAAGLYGPYSFARTFPNMCLNIQITTITNGAADGGYGSGKNVIMVPNDLPPSASGFSIYNNAEAAASNSAMGFYYFAVGF